ncbi:MAG: COX15/CtaA family protein [Blastocatellia bacterium]
MKLSRFAKYAWGVLAFNLAVIMWGAYVRASSSGAGCGSHWPLCNGEIIPRSPSIKTLIEFSHRLTSGLALLMTIALLVWAFRAFAKKHPARMYAALSMFFMLMEAAIGAGLVLFEYVAENKSIARAFWMSGHLINTFLMLATLTLTAWTASVEDQTKAPELKQRSLRWIFVAAFVGALILGVSGAVTALGGTLFPVASLAEGLKQDLSPTSHVLIRLRFYHPFIAIGVGALLMLTAAMARSVNAWTRKFSTAVIALVLVQLGAGLVNLLLHAPTWLQVIHLLLSDLVWIALILLAFTATKRPRFYELS